MGIHNVEEFKAGFNQALTRLGSGYIIAMMTDVLCIQTLEKEEFDREYLYKKAVEIRMFNEEEEVKWFRGMNRELHCREIKDQKGMNPLLFWDEWQYLDIDEKRSKPGQGIAYATGGGKYELPLDDYKDAKIKIRNYLEYEEDTKQLYISDWRAVGFSNESGGIDYGRL